MKTFYLVPIVKGKTYTFFCCYILTKGVPELFAPCWDNKSAERIKMDYNNDMSKPPFGFKIHWENQRDRLLKALTQTLSLTGFNGPHKAFILNGYSVLPKLIKVTKR